MARTPIKRQAGPPASGDGLEFSTYVDANGNLWVTGSTTVSGVAPGVSVPVNVSGNFPVQVTGTTATNIAQLGGQPITQGQQVSAKSIPVVIASNQSPLGLAVPGAPLATVPQNSTSVAYEAARLAKNSPGVCLGLSGFNSKATAQFISLFDATVVPANGATPVLFMFVASNASFSFDFGQWGRPFNNGIVAANSSTGPTLTAGSADTWFDVQYV